MNTASTRVAAPPRGITRLAGWALLVPFGLCWLLTLVVPTARTITNSFSDVQFGPAAGATQWIGMANYTYAFANDGLRAALGVIATLTITRLLVLLTVPLVVGLTIGMARRRVRLAVRLLFSVPVALFWPVGAALVGLMAFAPPFGLFAAQAGAAGWFASPRRALAAVALSDGLFTYGLACALAVTVGNLLLRTVVPRTDATPGRARTFGLVWLVAALATVALTLQTIILPLIMTGGGPGQGTTTLALLQFTQAFQQMRLGLGAASATLQLLGAGVLGLAAGLVIIRARLALVTATPAAPDDNAARTNPRATVLLGGALLGSIAVGLIGAAVLGWVLLLSFKTDATFASGGLFAPPFSFENYRQVLEQLPVARIALTTLVPTLAALVVQILVAYLGALGIGGLRPLGRASTWLLLPFSPWLFVTIGPLSIAFFQFAYTAGLLNSPLALTPPMLCSVPMLFVLTLFFYGQERRWRMAQAAGASQSFVRAVVAPSLPLAALLACIGLLVQLHLFVWQSTLVVQPGLQTIDVALVKTVSTFLLSYPAQAATLVLFGLPLFIVFFTVFILFQVLYMDRLALVREPDAAAAL